MGKKDGKGGKAGKAGGDDSEREPMSPKLPKRYLNPMSMGDLELSDNLEADEDPAETLERLARERDEAVQFAARAHPQPEPELTMASTPNKSRQKAKVHNSRSRSSAAAGRQATPKLSRTGSKPETDTSLPVPERAQPLFFEYRKMEIPTWIRRTLCLVKLPLCLLRRHNGSFVPNENVYLAPMHQVVTITTVSTKMDDLHEGHFKEAFHGHGYPEQPGVRFLESDNVVVTMLEPRGVSFRGRLINDPWEALEIGHLAKP